MKLRINVLNSEPLIQVIDPEEIISYFDFDAFLALQKDFVFILKKTVSKLPVSEKSDLLKIPENYRILLKNNSNNAELPLKKKMIKLKNQRLNENFEMIEEFLFVNKITSTNSLKESLNEFISKVITNSKSNPESSIFVSFMSKIEVFLSLCFVLFSEQIFAFFCKKQVENIVFYPQNFENLPKCLSKRAKIHKLVLKLNTEELLFQKTKLKKLDIYKEPFHEEDDLILNAIKEQERRKLEENWLENLEKLLVNQLGKNLLESSNNTNLFYSSPLNLSNGNIYRNFMIPSPIPQRLNLLKPGLSNQNNNLGLIGYNLSQNFATNHSNNYFISRDQKTSYNQISSTQEKNLSLKKN